MKLMKIAYLLLFVAYAWLTTRKKASNSERTITREDAGFGGDWK